MMLHMLLGIPMCSWECPELKRQRLTKHNITILSKQLISLLHQQHKAIPKPQYMQQKHPNTIIICLHWAMCISGTGLSCRNFTSQMYQPFASVSIFCICSRLLLLPLGHMSVSRPSHWQPSLGIISWDLSKHLVLTGSCVAATSFWLNTWAHGRSEGMRNLQLNGDLFIGGALQYRTCILKRETRMWPRIIHKLLLCKVTKSDTGLD